MSKIRHNNGWKPVKLEGVVLSEGLDGLVGIEELTDYKLEKGKKKRKVIVCEENGKKERKVSQKRKSANEWQESSISPDEPVKKKTKDNGTEGKCKEKSKLKKSLKNGPSANKSIKLLPNVKDDADEDNMLNVNVQAWSTLGVPTPIIKALADQKFHSPTIIQSLTLAPAILGLRDILGAAETGSGKTLAFGIPIITGILELKKQRSSKESINKGIEMETNEDSSFTDSNNEEEENDLDENGIGCVRVMDKIDLKEFPCVPKKPLYALILTPTRELAIQIQNHLIKAAKYTDIKIAVLVGGMAAVKQERILSKGPEIVIATPGRLWELINNHNAHLSQIDSIKYLAIDETDRMLEKGHFQELHDLLERINENRNKLKQRQTFVFSATLTLVHDIPDYLQRKKKKYVRSKIFKLTPGQKLQKIVHMLGIKNPKIVDVTKESGTAASLTECRIACTIDHKDYYLYYFLKRHPGRTLVFCNSIGCVKRLATLFGILDCKPLPLHANMQQRQRLRNLERFQADENGLLIATDVAARGLDIPSVEHVIHYQVPRTSESYVHRSGRTARAQKEGITVLMMEPSEKQNYSKLCKTLGRTQDLPTFPVIDQLLIAVKERVDIAREIDKLELKSRRDNAQKGWLRKAVEDMDMILEEDEEEMAEEIKETADLRHQLKIKRRHLSSLLLKALFPKGFSGKYPDMNVSYDFNQNPEKAVEIMKKAIDKIPKIKKSSSKKVKKPSLKRGKSRNIKKT
ncbi:hypothetical protein KM043_004980 [Ampulex compressa]|nr:hypothetical protein KM043_004980 [Ampulex compressa]